MVIGRISTETIERVKKILREEGEPILLSTFVKRGVNYNTLKKILKQLKSENYSDLHKIKKWGDKK